MSGLDLSADHSEKRSPAVNRVISRKRKVCLRYALYKTALIASTRIRHLIIYYTNKLRGREKEKGIKIKMRVKLAAKLLIIVYPV